MSVAGASCPRCFVELTAIAGIARRLALRTIRRVGLGIGPGFWHPRCSARSLAMLEPPGRPRLPFRNAVDTFIQVSPGESRIAPELGLGHLPVREWWASAQARMPASVKGTDFLIRGELRSM
jgi:hypothetical protein